MPLDTQPLSRGRKALATGVVVLMFGASMGLAWGLVRARAHVENPRPVWREVRPEDVWNDGVKITIPVPKGFKAARFDDGGNVDQWTAEAARATFKMERMDDLLEPDEEVSHGGLVRAFNQQFNRRLVFTRDGTISLGGVETESFIGVTPAGETAAIAAAALVRGHLVIFVLSAEGDPPAEPISKAEIDAFKDALAGATVTVDGKPYPPAPASSRPAVRPSADPAPATAPATRAREIRL